MIFLGVNMEMRWARHPREFLVSTLESMIGRQARDLGIGNVQISHPALTPVTHDSVRLVKTVTASDI
jgi:hypothetical protein